MEHIKLSLDHLGHLRGLFLPPLPLLHYPVLQSQQFFSGFYQDVVYGLVFVQVEFFNLLERANDSFICHLH